MALSNRLFSDALSDIRELQRRMSVLDQPFFNTFTSPSNGASHHMVRFPATDIVEKNDIFEVQAELPGYDKNNIKIEMPDSQTLVLSGSVVQKSSGSSKDDADEEKQQETSNSEVVQKKEKNSQVSAKSHHHYWMNERISGSSLELSDSLTLPC
jgi:HSP20 family molecular chaperone IbpA